MWSFFLGAYRIHNNAELGETVANYIFELDLKKTPAPYVLLSNIYVVAGKFNITKNIRKLVKDNGVNNTFGCNWIEVNGQVHAFHFGDSSHPQIHESYTKLDRLTSKTKMAKDKGMRCEMMKINT